LQRDVKALVQKEPYSYWSQFHMEKPEDGKSSRSDRKHSFQVFKAWAASDVFHCSWYHQAAPDASLDRSQLKNFY